MARVTVEDCVLKVPNRFELVMMAAGRAKSLEKGTQTVLDRDNDKNTVIALREIAEGVVDLETLKNALVTDLQKVKEKDAEPAPKDEEVKAIDMAADENLMNITDDEETLSNNGFSEATEDNNDSDES